MVAPTKRLDGNGVTAGALLTTSNTDLDQVIVTGAASATAETAAALRGSKGVLVTGAATEVYSLQYTDTAGASASVQTYFRSNASPTVSSEFVGIRSASGNMGRITESTAGQLILQDGAGATVAWSGGVFTRTTGVKYRCQVQVTKGTTTANGTVTGQIYDDSDTLVRSGTSTTANAGIVDATTGRCGKVTSGSAGVNMHLDEFAFITGTTAEIDPVSVNTPPTAGVDQAVDPYTLVTLVALDAETTPSWSQTGGSPTVTLGGSGATRTFVAPAVRAGTILTFTASDGTLTDSMTVTVYAHNEFAVIGGVEVPFNTVVVSDPGDSALMLHWDADTLTGANLSAVSLWPSVVGTGTAEQVTGTNQPLLVTSGLNGHRTVRFDGVNDLLELNVDALSLFENVGNLAIFVVYKLTGLPTATRVPFGVSTGTGTGTRAAVYQNVNVTNVHQAGGRRLDADGFASVTGGGSTTGEAGVLTALFRYQTSDLILFKDGTQIGSNTSFQTDGNVSETASIQGHVGAGAAGAEFFSGDIAEIRVYNSADLDGSLRTAVHDAFETKYAITMA